jgi:hypothetical protein
MVLLPSAQVKVGKRCVRKITTNVQRSVKDLNNALNCPVMEYLSVRYVRKKWERTVHQLCPNCMALAAKITSSYNVMVCMKLVFFFFFIDDSLLPVNLKFSLLKRTPYSAHAHRHALAPSTCSHLLSFSGSFFLVAFVTYRRVQCIAS